LSLGPSSWHEALTDASFDEAERQTAAHERATTFRLPEPRSAKSGLLGWLDGNVGEADDTGARAQVRDSEDSIEVLVVQAEGGGQWRIPDWLDHPLKGTRLPAGQLPTSLQKALAATSVRLPAFAARGWRGDRVISDLEGLIVEEWQKTPGLAGELVLALNDDARAVVGGFDISYDQETGLEARWVG
jgi:hypothetical protein